MGPVRQGGVPGYSGVSGVFRECSGPVPGFADSRIAVQYCKSYLNLIIDPF